ncbi:hypothetical protein ANCCAN_18761 [Ancylostoma caninum]|uniref:Uncharacterized protein n=1 Tax=Ancylostoma caninum TaxID=29170 RepID=A0A368FX84_ANCCA|nr:hypothetical protein ANCCAN_18761 [Ancylostoma caninum]
MCHRLAYYDKNRKQCQCYKKEDDILNTKLFPLSDIQKSIKPGTQCLDCSGKGDQDISLILDDSLNAPHLVSQIFTKYPSFPLF